MIRYAIRRTLYMIPILFGVALITFLLFHVAGGDPILALAGKNASAAEIARLRAQYGFDRPLWQQFIRYLGELATFNFERSFDTHQTVRQMIADGIGVSLALALPAFLMSQVLAIIFALVAAATRGTWIDRTIVVASLLGMSLSILAYILFGQYILAYRLALFPISGFEFSFPDAISYLALPWLIWIALSVGADVRFFRTIFLEELSQDYVRTARAKGAGSIRILFVHVLRNALIPIITRSVVEIPFLLTGSLLLESFFGIPGLGHLMVNAFYNADWPVIKAITFFGAALYVLANLLSDLLYARADPRVILP